MTRAMDASQGRGLSLRERLVIPGGFALPDALAGQRQSARCCRCVGPANSDNVPVAVVGTAAKYPLLSFTPGGWRLEQDRYLPSAMTATPSLLSVRRCLMATYSGDSYQALAASLVANFSTTLTCPADPSSSSESRSTTIASAPWACKVGPTAARYFRYPAWSVIV